HVRRPVVLLQAVRGGAVLVGVGVRVHARHAVVDRQDHAGQGVRGRRAGRARRVGARRSRLRGGVSLAGGRLGAALLLIAALVGAWSLAPRPAAAEEGAAAVPAWLTELSFDGRWRP